MSDNITLNAGSGGATVATDDDGTAHHQYVKLEAGADGTQTKILAGGGTEAGALRVTVASDSTGVVSVDDNGSTLSVDDGGSSLTVDNAALSVVGGGTEATAMRVTVASDSTGVLSVDDNGGSLTVDGTVAVTGVATAANQSTIIGHVDGIEGLLTTIDADTSILSAAIKAEDAAHTTADTGIPSLAVRRDTPTSLAGADNDYLPLTTNARGAAWVAVDDTVSVSVDDAGGSLTVDVGTALPAGTNNIGDVDIASGTITTVSTVAAITGGGVAHDAADSGNPIKVGGRAVTADITAVAANDRTDSLTDSLGYHLVRPYTLHANLVSGATAAITDTTSTSVIAAGGAGTRNYITSVLVTNSHATVGTLVTITDGSGGTTLYRGYAAPEGGGYAVSFPTPLRLSDNTALHAVCGTTGSNTYVSASGYRATN